MFGDGNSQLVEILPPRLAGTNKTYTIQIALDGKNFLDVPSVKLTVNNESLKGQGADGMNWVECGKEDLFNITATYVDEKGKEIAPAYKAQGYIISEWETYTPSIQAKDIEGYELVSAPDMSQYQGFIGNKKDYNFQFKYRKLGSTDSGGQGEGGNGSGSGTGGNTGTGGQSGSGNNGQNDAGNQNKKPVAQNTSATTNNGKVAKTGDTAPILPIAAVAVISLAGVAVVFKKKREVK